MLDGILSRGFAAKCKSLIKLTKSRIDVIRRKRKATEKFLKKDIADLLANGLEINAYNRAEGLLAELTVSSCYDFIEQSGDFVSKHLSVMQKLSGCPEECREAVASLMFAAARFSDLPELRDLRQIFQERYGNSLECYVNHEFSANMNSRSPTLERKVHLMQDITLEFSIKWDSKAFERRMSNPAPIAQEHKTCNRNRMTDITPPQRDGSTQNGVKYDVVFERSPEHPSDRYRFQNGNEAVVSRRDDYDLQSRSKLPKNGFKPLNGYDEVIMKRDGCDNPLPGRQEVPAVKNDRSYWKEGSMLKPIGLSNSFQDRRAEQFEGGSKLHDSRGNTTPKRDGHDNPLPGRQEVPAVKIDRGYWKEGSMLKPIGLGNSTQDRRAKQFEGGSKLHDSRGNIATKRESQDAAASGVRDFTLSHGGLSDNEPFAANHGGLHERKVQKDETPTVKPYYNNAIPPPYVKPNSKHKSNAYGANAVSSHVDGDGIPRSPSIYDKPDAASASERIQSDFDNHDQERQANRHARPRRHHHAKDLSVNEDPREVPVLPKPKSMRRKRSKSRSSRSDAINEDNGVATRKSTSRKRDDPRRGLQILFDDEQSRDYEEERLIDKLLIHYSKKPSIPVPERARKSRSRHAHQLDDNSAGEYLKNGSTKGPDETPDDVTLPSRSVSLPREQASKEVVNKVFSRAATFQPDRSNEAKHVHPKLPDYDDLAARFAALRGR
ncbi:hypothetical protein L6164_007975 [Bauhinia variegata]|uniref:Uncharacterized protein n=1 Tax=Bauhinia variegata TaxID=167791 RepID=A0ACB9PGE7_BAUVA|nr:hypothetical protein L6164_007975 [Bauhinia variegata]